MTTTTTTTTTTLTIPPLIVFTLHKSPSDASLGLHLRAGGPDGTSVEVARISPGGPASRTPLREGHEILSVNGHRVKDVGRCVEMMKFYCKNATKNGSKMELVASAGARPSGALYVMAKRKADNIDEESRGCKDGSFHGLFLQEASDGRVRVSGKGDPSGTLYNSKINVGDVLLSLDGRIVHSVEDARRAMNKASRGLIPVLTYNLFRRVRSGICVRPRAAAADKGGGVSGASGGNGRAAAAASATAATDGSDDRGEKPRGVGGGGSGRTVGDLYAFGPTIGSGGFSVVKKCQLKSTGETFAMKIVNRRKMDKSLERALNDEISILKGLNHPHIIHLYDTFATINSYYLVTEYLDGGELFDRIVEKQTYTEKEARDVCRTLFGAIGHCHEHRIAHRDLKPENLLLKERTNDMDIKIADFGFAKVSPSENYLTTICGSPGYVSPEVLKKVPYGTKTDMWSIGVIMFILLGGYPPFQKANQKEQFEDIKKGKYKFIPNFWASITTEAKLMIQSLLCVDPKERVSAREALERPWMQVASEKLKRSSLVSNIEGIKEVNSKRKFKSAVKLVLFMNRIAQTTTSNNDVMAEGGDEDNMESGMNSAFNLRRKEKSLFIGTE